ncbi:hypothetical protein [Kitasatospora sp. NBC_00458]|uniref:hypothetical protein n=1 Tax=Kitasatospora sp. NBC_00458 TaxID=2903568 RepID=UPI002E170B5D
MTSWPRWNQEGEDAALAKYVRPDEVAALVRLPGPAGGSRLDQARAVYEALAGAGITYSYEAPSDEAGRQAVRQPAEVLWSPRHATCLDLALVLAAACLHAGLHPFVLLVDPPGGSGPGHALLGVRVDDPDPGEPRPPDTDLWAERPEDWDDLVRAEVHGPARPLLVLDPVGLAHALPTSPITGTGAAFADAARTGARYAADWRWRTAVDIARLWHAQDTHTPSVHRADDPLRAPYLPFDPQVHRPLRLLRPEHNAVRFQARDELTVLTDWCRSVAEGQHTGVAVVHGVGGAGKTRLALEVAHRLAEQHDWYAGYLRKDTPGLDWLGVVVSPTLIVLDYADARPAEARELFRVLRRRAERGAAPAVVLMTARSTDGQWLPDLRRAWLADGHPCRERPPMMLPPEHPDGRALARRAVEAFGPGARALAPEDLADAAPQDWTTLDRLLLAFLASRTPDRERLPATRAELYEEVLDHERSYWAQVYRRATGTTGDAPLDVLDRAVTCLTLRAPTGRKATAAALRAVEELADDARWREQIRGALTDCLQPAPGEPLALRPDPIADHLTLRTLREDEELLTAALSGLGEDQVVSALRQFNRAAAADQATAAGMVADWTAAGAERWRPALTVATDQGGAVLEALGRLVDAPEAPVWLAELAETIPFTSIGVPHLALRAEQRRLDAALAAAGTTDHQIGILLNRLGRRRHHTGDQAAGLTAFTRAVGIYRRLAIADPAFLTDLTASLNNLAVQQFQVGDRATALTTVTEAVTLYRRLAEADPAYRPALASSLNNLATQQSTAGDKPGALASVTEAVNLVRRLAEADPAAHLPDLASALTNLAADQADNGDRATALTTVTEAVTHYRRLAEADPAAHLPRLATSLGNLAKHRSDQGDRTGALAAATEAVNLVRHLVRANPAVFLPDLAAGLDNLAVHRSDHGDRAGALAAATEAVVLARRLADADPATQLTGLAGILSNLAVHQSGLGDRASALASATEAVTLHRRLAEADPAAHLPGLVRSLNTLANRRSDQGDRAGALADASEAVGLIRRLAEADPAIHLPVLARSLNNLSVHQSARGDRSSALASATEAVGLIRRLAGADPAAHLADALNNLANEQADNGERAAALATATEAVIHYRRLAEAAPAAFAPDLAGALTNLADGQAANGDRAAALATATEAVDRYLDLADTNPAAFLPLLADALNSLADRQAANGSRADALSTSSEATAICRQLAADEPEVFLPQLAYSLRNLGTHQSRTGDDAAALASVTEAVTHYRRLAGTDPAAFAPHLADALNQLATLDTGDSKTGSDAAALASATEAVTLHRRLAEADPAAFAPHLAGALDNLALQQSRTGSGAAALASATEAVSRYRRLAGADPVAHLPHLAGALDNLALQQFDSGNRAGALDSTAEAVTHYRRLAEADPTDFLSGLTRALHSLAALHTDREPAHTAWQDALAALRGRPLPQAVLRAHYAYWLAGRGDHRRALELLVEATGAAAHGEPRQLGAARLEIRTLVSNLPTTIGGLPGWATDPLPKEFIGLLDVWGGQEGWPDVERFLHDHADRLRTPAGRDHLRLAGEMFPEDSDIADLTRVLDDIDALGLPAVLAAGRREHDAMALAAAWTALPTWTESQAFHAAHRSELHDPRFSEVLSQVDDPEVRRHLAIVRLARVMPLQQVYGIVADPDLAVDEALAAVEAADLDRLGAVEAACPELLDHTHGGLFALVILLGLGRTDATREIAAVIIEHGGDVQREAYAVHLRNLARRLPELAPLAGELADAIHPG